MGLFTVLVAGVGAGPVASFLGMVAKVALLCIGIVVWVRLSLAAPATCAQGRLIVLQSWSMTKGQFWRLLGSYVLAFAIGAVVFVVSLVSMIVVFGISAGDPADFFRRPKRPYAGRGSWGFWRKSAFCWPSSAFASSP